MRPYPNRSREFPWLVAAIAAHHSDECLLWPFSKTDRGYGRCKFEHKTRRVHRLAFFVVYGRWPEPCARHICDVPACFNPRHIVEGTHSDNMADQVAHGRSRKGMLNPAAKLTDEIVRQIRAEYVPGAGQRIAEKYGVYRNIVHAIVKGQRWQHVK